jgi:hypothetical protein
LPFILLIPNRIYVHGLSNGATWTWAFAVERMQRLWQLWPQCQELQLNDTDLLYTPIRLSQGGLDKNPAPNWTQTIVDWFNNNGGQLEYLITLPWGTAPGIALIIALISFHGFCRKRKIRLKFALTKLSTALNESVNTTMGFTPGFSGYRWYKDGGLIGGQTSNSITVTELGIYTGEINNRGTWYLSDPVEIKIKAPTVTPPIQLAQLQSVVIPDINGNSNVGLTLPSGYETYSYSRAGIEIGTTQSISVTTPGSYSATVKEFGGCSSNPSVPLLIINANGTPKPDPISNLQVTSLSKTQLRLNWDNNLTPALNETGFEIYRSLVAGGPYTLITITQPDVLVYTDNNLNANTTYHYKIRPISNSGAAAASASASGLTDVDIIPPNRS